MTKTETKRAIKSAQNILNQRAYLIDTGSYISNGAQYIGGNYSAVRLFNPLPLPEISPDKSPDYSRFINDAQKTAVYEISTPARDSLRAYIKEQKAEHKGERKYRVLWDYGEGAPLVDARLLLEI